MYLDITGKGLGYQKITGCMCMYVCVSMWEYKRRSLTGCISKNLYAKWEIHRWTKFRKCGICRLCSM